MGEQEFKHVLDSIWHFTDYIARAKVVIKVVDRIEETITILNEAGSVILEMCGGLNTTK